MTIGSCQTAAMNLVVDQARNELKGQEMAISQQSGGSKIVVEESTEELQSIMKGCEDFRNRVQRFAEKVETERECMKMVANQVAQGHAQEMGAAKQRITDTERGFKKLGPIPYIVALCRC